MLQIPSDVQGKISEGEKKLDVFNLVIIRQRIELEVARLEKKSEENKKKTSWFSSWWGKAASDEDKELSTTADISTSYLVITEPNIKIMFCYYSEKVRGSHDA